VAKEKVVDTLDAGGYFGEISLIDREPRSASVIAETDVRTLSLANFNFRLVLRAHPELTYKLLVHLCGLFRRERALYL